MNLTQMHERLRLELLRKIQRGTLSLSLLSRQTGLATSHLSNFLHGKRGLSFDAADRILAAQQITPADLLPAPRQLREFERVGVVPLVSDDTAMQEPVVRPSAIRRILHIPEEILLNARARTGPARKAWLRFVAIHVGADDAAAMRPIILPDALLVIDRHYNSLLQYRPDRPNLYAVRHNARLIVRYADFQASHLVLRPSNSDAAVELIEMAGDEAPGDLIAGRVVAVLNPF